MPIVCLKQWKFQITPAYLVFIVYSSGLNQTVYLGGLNNLRNHFYVWIKLYNLSNRQY
jgi:hypothetical protein